MPVTHEQRKKEFDLLTNSANYIRDDFEHHYEEWQGSPFEWVQKIPSGSRGKLGKRLVSQWCAVKGLNVQNSPDSEADILVNGHRVEIKFSTLWAAGIYKFQQIRDQNYELIICLGISPNDAHCWVLPKYVLNNFVIGKMGQHRGAKANDTDWLTINPNNPPDWTIEYGGALYDAFVVLQKLVHNRRI